MRNAAFTIVARNYLAFACTLADSFKSSGSAGDFFIYVIDGLDDLPEEIKKVYPLREINAKIVPDIRSMSFRYNVTEFSTAVKPFVFHHLFEEEEYDKCIYFDPDMYLYQPADSIFQWLDDKSCILTPHVITPQVEFTGNMPDTEFLYAGIYNLGFIALRKGGIAGHLLLWWMNRLRHLCYGERLEALHVDQKWMDFAPAFFGEDVLSSRHPGCNIAYWNIHERLLTEQDGTLFASSIDSADEKFPVIFLHLSGVNPLDIYHNKQCKTLDISKYPVWEKHIAKYAAEVLAHQHEKLIKTRYGYAAFPNGDPILSIHRRLYRRLTELGLTEQLSDPYDTKSGSYYSKLKRYKLLVTATPAGDVKENTNPGNTGNLKKMIFLLRLVKRLMGIRKYQVFMKFLQKIMAAENHLFLLREYEDELVDYYSKKYLT
ncbi:MAG: hypothetical protein JNM88_18055 [Chitinophagaceae bacterium]|nr:hypothetical protein [Chitinophagaceae bacterium]